MPENKDQIRARRYDSMLQGSADGILLLESVRDDDGMIVDFIISHCNEVARKLGRLPKNTLGKTLLSLLPHLESDEQYILHKLVIETGKPVQFETTFRNDKGEQFGWFMVFLQKLDDCVLSRFVDVTDKKLNEEKIALQANLLNSIFDGSQHGIFALQAVKDTNGNIVDFKYINCNNQYAALVYLPKKDIIGKSYLTLFRGSVGLEQFTAKCNVIATGKPLQKEFFYFTNSLKGWFNISITKLGNDGVVQTMVDVTETKLDKERFRTIINTSQAGILTLQPVRGKKGDIINFEVNMTNNVIEHIFCAPMDQITGEKIDKWYGYCQPANLFGFLIKTYETAEACSFEIVVKRQQPAYYKIRVDKLEQELLVTITDFTGLKLLHMQLNTSIEALKQSNNNLEEFTSSASHDLKEPIRKINLLLSHIKSRYTDVWQNDPFKSFDKLQVATTRMLTMVDDLLTFSHLSFQRPETEVVPLADLVKRVMDEADITVLARGIKVSINKLPVINGYPLQLYQMFQNLFGNAIKYRNGEVPLILLVKAKKVASKDVENIQGNYQQYPIAETGYWKIMVTDNGIGFEQQYAERIFNIFVRLHGNHQYKGSGVGLAIVKKVVENHNGFIAVESSPGKGTTFCIYLPAM